MTFSHTFEKDHSLNSLLYKSISKNRCLILAEQFQQSPIHLKKIILQTHYCTNPFVKEMFDLCKTISALYKSEYELALWSYGAFDIGYSTIFKFKQLLRTIKIFWWFWSITKNNYYDFDLVNYHSLVSQSYCKSIIRGSKSSPGI